MTRVSYDSSTDYLMLYLTNEALVDSEGVTDDVTVSYDKEDRVAAIEIARASKLFKPLVDAVRSEVDIGSALRKERKSA